VAVEGPYTRVVCLQADGDLRARRDDHRIPKCADDVLAVNLQNFEVMAVQVHRVRHAGAIREIDFHTFSDSDIEGVAIGVSRAIDRPDIVLHLAAKGCGQSAVCGPRQGFGRTELSLLGVV
jgi:hypothetical protein